MGWKSFFKGLGKGALKVAGFVPIPGVPPAVQREALKYIKAGVAVAEAKGGAEKAKAALAAVLPELRKRNIDLPEKKIHLLIELLLDSDTGGDFAFDETRAANIAKSRDYDVSRIAELIEEAS